ncbi:MAG: hypothetical protein N3D71_01935 [Burkholderiaceae bacterium]|nr:hypothetical protein [Burkholderiaceae bacterium]
MLRAQLAAPPERPPGWKPRGLYDEEKTFVAPQATVKVAADGVRSLPSQAIKDRANSTRLLVDNPYLDPADPFFNIPRQMACLPDGSVVVFSTAKRHTEGRMKGNPYATGLWRIAPDGAITAVDRARHILSEGKDPECGVTVGRSGLDPANVGPVTAAADGSLVFPYQTAWTSGRAARVLRITPAGRVEPLPATDPLACAPRPPDAYRSTFSDVSSVALDAEGNLWAKDGCRLLRVAPTGVVTTLLDVDRVCPPDQTRDHWITGSFMAWDVARGEMVIGGSIISGKPRDLFSTVWRVRPDGTFRRVYLARKVGAPPQIDGLSGLALDAKGTIHFGAGLLSQGGGHQILRLVDEAKGRTEVVAGAPRPTDVRHADGPARQAHFGTVKGLCFAPDGTLFVHDANHLIRKITPAGQVATWAF